MEFYIQEFIHKLIILSSSLNLNVNSIHFPNNNINKIILQIEPRSISITTHKYDLF